MVLYAYYNSVIRYILSYYTINLNLVEGCFMLNLIIEAGVIGFALYGLFASIILVFT